MDIQKILDRASTLRIAVIGDLIVDHYICGSVDRVSPEAPVPVLLKGTEKTTMGGAGNVWQNLTNLGVHAELFCNFNGDALWHKGYDDRIHCNPYPYSKKTRVMCGNHQLLRIDEELQGNDMQWQTFKQFYWWEYLMNNSGDYDAFVISDYGKGVVSDSVIGTLMEYQFINRRDRKHSPVIVDAKKNFKRFYGAYCVKANDKESDDDIIQDCIQNRGINFFVRTRGDQGMVWYNRTTSGGVKGEKVNIVDVSGAGDTVTAMLAILMSDEGVRMSEVMWLANMAAAEVCKHPGVYAIQKEDLQHLIMPLVEYEDVIDEGKNK